MRVYLYRQLTNIYREGVGLRNKNHLDHEIMAYTYHTNAIALDSILLKLQVMQLISICLEGVQITEFNCTTNTLTKSLDG